MRQYDSINDEIEVGYDDRFEDRWHYVMIVGRAVMLIIVGCALFGLLGQGPYSHHTVISASGRLTIDYEPVARFSNQTQITMHVKPLSCDQGMTIWLNSKFAEPMGLLAVLPRPVSSTPLADGMLLRFALDPTNCQNAVVRLYAKPSANGFVALQARLDDDRMLPFRAFIVP